MENQKKTWMKGKKKSYYYKLPRKLPKKNLIMPTKRIYIKKKNGFTKVSCIATHNVHTHFLFTPHPSWGGGGGLLMHVRLRLLPKYKDIQT